MASPFVHTLTSFSGADLVVSFGPKVVGELQQISYAIQREKVPVFTLGNPNARSFSRGKRAIAGSLVFAIFDKDILLETVKEMWDQIAPPAMFTAAGNIAQALSEDFANAIDLAAWNRAASENPSTTGNFGFSGPEALNLRDTVPGSVTGSQVYQPSGFNVIRKANVQYVDQLPPFDVTMTFANEYGQTAFQKIYDMEILNESAGVSVDSVVMEKNYTWIARNISPLIKGVYYRAQGGMIKAHSAVADAGVASNWGGDVDVDYL